MLSGLTFGNRAELERLEEKKKKKHKSKVGSMAQQRPLPQANRPQQAD